MAVAVPQQNTIRTAILPCDAHADRAEVSQTDWLYGLDASVGKDVEDCRLVVGWLRVSSVATCRLTWQSCGEICPTTRRQIYLPFCFIRRSKMDRALSGSIGPVRTPRTISSLISRSSDCHSLVQYHAWSFDIATAGASTIFPSSR